MRFIIEDKYLEENKLTLNEVLAGLLAKNDILKTIDDLVQEHKILYNNGKIIITQGFNDVVDSICLSSNPDLPSYGLCLQHAKALRSLVPKCPKKGTPYYYCCNNAEITLALQRFFYYYGYDLEDFKGNKPNEFDNIFNHIYHIVKDFYSRFTKDNAAYFPLLKYFIIKIDGDDISSPLMSEFEIVRLEMIRDGTNRSTTEYYRQG